MAIKRGTSKRDVLSGTAGHDRLFGLGGNDVLAGSTGNDLLDGGTGADRMTGGKGNDTYIVDNAGDRVIEAANQGTDTVKSSVTHTLSANAEHLILTGTKSINGTLSSSLNEIGNSLTGNNANNFLNGGLGHDVLAGRLGVDVLNGGDGNDTLIPGAGNGVPDVIDGGAGFDTVDYRDALGRVYIDINNFGNVIGDAAAGDVISNVEGVVGSAFGDILTTEPETAPGFNSFAFGGGGGDTIYATAAVYDRIRGDDGYDHLVGNFDSADDFWLQYDRGMDYVQEYRHNGTQDHVFIVGSEFGLATTPGNFLNASEFDIVIAFGIPDFSASERLIMDVSTGVLWGDKDGAGFDFDPVAIAVFGANSANPSPTDIFVI